MVEKNDLESDDKFTLISEELERIGRAVSLGQKKEKYTNWSIVGVLVAALSGGGYYIQRVPKVADPADIKQFIQSNPEVARHDPWTGTEDRDAMDDLRAAFILDHDRIVSEHTEINHRIGKLEDRLSQGGLSREHGRINGLDDRLKLIENRR